MMHAAGGLEIEGGASANSLLHIPFQQITMDYKEPKTRREMKGRDRERDGDPYSQKRVRQLEALMEKKKGARSTTAAKSR